MHCKKKTSEKKSWDMFTHLLAYEMHFVRRFTSEVFSPGAVKLNCQSVLKSLRKTVGTVHSVSERNKRMFERTLPFVGWTPKPTI